MAQSASGDGAHDAHEHHELGFLRTYIFSTDHKMIARQFLFLGLFMMVLGGLLALVVRWQLAWPETPVPGLGSGSSRRPGGIIAPEIYNMAFTMHATIMIFFVIMPILVGVLRQLPDPADDRRPRHGVSRAQHAVVLDRVPCGRHHAGRLLRGGRPRRGGLDVLRAAVVRARSTRA